MNVFDYLVPIAIGAVFVVLCLGLWNMMRGGPGNRSQHVHALARDPAVHRHHRHHGRDLVAGR